jgi:hypothetical protein
MNNEFVIAFSAFFMPVTPRPAAVCQATPAVGAGLDAREYLSSEAQRLLRETAALPSMEARELCRVRWLIYRGDENYGLGNVLYDVASAAALALALNRTLVYGADAVDRKFGTLLQWPGLLTMRDADELRRRAQCHPERWQLSAQRRVVFAPDKCTFQRTWRRERSGKGRCFKRLLGIDSALLVSWPRRVGLWWFLVARGGRRAARCTFGLRRPRPARPSGRACCSRCSP